MELPKNRYDVQDREELRELFELLQETETEIWLVMYKKNSGITGLKRIDLLEEAMCFGWIDGKVRTIDSQRYMMRFSPRKKKSTWSMGNKNIALKMMKAGKMTPSGYKMVEEAKANGNWDNAYTTGGEPILPNDLKEAFKGEKIAFQHFTTFTWSQQNSYIQWINTAKRPETRERRIRETVSKSRENIKRG